MKSIREFLMSVMHGTRGGFNTYYGDVARSGVGYPTADEARRDRANRESMTNPYTFTR